MKNSLGTSTLSRRSFAHLILRGAILCVGGLVGTWGAAYPASKDNPVLDDRTIRVLIAMAEALVGLRPLRGHYESYYRHQAFHFSRYVLIYRQFSEDICLSARKAGFVDFFECDLDTRFAMLQSLRATPEGRRKFEIPVIQETLAVYQATDVWLQLGYPAWPGTARGLDSYRRRCE